MGSTTERVLGRLCLFFVKRGNIMRVNGNNYTLDESISLSAFLKKEGYDETRVVVERNLAIVPRDSYGEVMLLDSDSLEIVHFVGGG